VAMVKGGIGVMQWSVM